MARNYNSNGKTISTLPFFFVENKKEITCHYQTQTNESAHLEKTKFPQKKKKKERVRENGVWPNCHEPESKEEEWLSEDLTDETK